MNDGWQRWCPDCDADEANCACDTDALDTDDLALDPLHEESPQAAWERLGLEDAWVNDYSPRRGFAG